MVIVLQSWGEGLWRDGVRDVEVYAHVHVCEGAMIRHPFCPNTGMVASWGFRILVDHLGKEVNASLHRDCAEIGVRERGGEMGRGVCLESGSRTMFTCRSGMGLLVMCIQALLQACGVHVLLGRKMVMWQHGAGCRGVSSVERW